ncbi:MAG: ATP phosphoribosyltransferase regulatory subunit [Pseudomonadota bacterium]
MPTKADIRAEGARLQAGFLAAGAMPVDPDILLPAETLLDLYGEDIRARAYVTSDPLRGEQMLRPDFTVPVVQDHIARAAGPARYTYSGEVFRQQENDPSRASEYLQVGFERFGGEVSEADAEVFALVTEALVGLPVRPVVGDIGLLIAAVSGLTTSERRKAALMRHIWRPARFRSMVARFSRPAKVREVATTTAPHVGLRSEAEIAERLSILADEAAQPPLPGAEARFIDALLSIKGPVPEAAEALKSLGNASIREAVALFADRLSALEARGTDLWTLHFEASYGRSLMEYYDGFVFGFQPKEPGATPVATGGRYDALTRVLGQGRAVPAVGAVIRPGLTLELRT